MKLFQVVDPAIKIDQAQQRHSFLMFSPFQRWPSTAQSHGIALDWELLVHLGTFWQHGDSLPLPSSSILFRCCRCCASKFQISSNWTSVADEVEAITLFRSHLEGRWMPPYQLYCVDRVGCPRRLEGWGGVLSVIDKAGYSRIQQDTGTAGTHFTWFQWPFGFG